MRVDPDDSYCDTCGPGIVSWVFAELPPSERLPHGGELSFCAHHGKKYYDGLCAAHADILDLSYLVLEEK